MTNTTKNGVRGAGLGSGVLVAWAFEQLTGNPMPPEVAAAAAGLIVLVFEFAREQFE